ncbi:hypothetical protein SLE2022_302370 [Rubroshorea leprosula]
MSDTETDSPTTLSTNPQSKESPYLMSDADSVKDIFLWRRKKATATTLLASTAIWVLLDKYQFKFITVASWVAMSVAALSFLWGNLLRLVGREPPNLSRLEISEEYTVEIANSFRTLVEAAVRWMFDVSVERDLFTFAGVLAEIFLLSYVGSSCDLLTLLYAGTLMGMTVPVTYVKYEDKLKRGWERIMVQYRTFQENLVRKVSNYKDKKT